MIRLLPGQLLLASAPARAAPAAPITGFADPREGEDIVWQRIDRRVGRYHSKHPNGGLISRKMETWANLALF